MWNPEGEVIYKWIERVVFFVFFVLPLTVLINDMMLWILNVIWK